MESGKCPNGHPYAQHWHRASGISKGYCKACRSDIARRYREAKRAAR